MMFMIFLICVSLQSFREGLEKANSKDEVRVIYEKEVRQPYYASEYMKDVIFELQRKTRRRD